MNIRIVKLIKLNVLFTYNFWFAIIKARQRYLGGLLSGPFYMTNPNLRWKQVYPKFKNQLKRLKKYRHVLINNEHNTVALCNIGIHGDTVTEVISHFAANI